MRLTISQPLSDGKSIIITVYEPDPLRWDESFRRRIKR
jgi:hypothetical protein